MIRIEYNMPLGEVEFQKVYDLIIKCYGPSVFAYPGRAKARFDRCRDCFILAWDEDRLVGAFVIYPVTQKLWQYAQNSSAVLDDDVEANDIVPLSKIKPNILMIMDSVTDPEYRHHGLADRMMEALRQWMRDRLNEGYEFERIFAFLVSSAGERLGKKNGGLVRRIMPDGRGRLLEIPINRFLDPAHGEIQFHWGKSLPEELIPQAFALEMADYGPEVYTHPGNAMDRLQVCSEYFVWATDGERLVGAQFGFPIKPGVMEDAIKRRIYLDDALRPDQIAPYPLEEPRDYLSVDILVDPEYRGKGIARRLSDESRRMLSQKVRQEGQFGRYYGYAITQEGLRMAMHQGGYIVQEMEEGPLFAINISDFIAGIKEDDHERTEADCDA